MQTGTLPYAKKSKSIYQDLVLKVMVGMNQGSLHLTLQDGEQLTIGNGEGDITANIRIHDVAFYSRILLYGDVGFGEAYVDGLWDTDNITNVIKWALLNVENTPGLSGSQTKKFVFNFFSWINRWYHNRRANTLNGSRKNISAHYDLDNDFFASFLDPTMTYSAAYYYKEGLSLEEAQIAKYERLCRQLRITKDDHVLEIGSGWGANAIYMARTYGCKVTSVTISQEQYKLALARVAAEKLENKVTILLKDYRMMKGCFDKIVSIEMLEAVGHDYLPVYFTKCHELLKKDGILAIQVITAPDSRYDSLRQGVDWIQKHIFPGSLLPSVAAINNAVNRSGDMTMVDLKDLGQDYARTLKAWFDAFNVHLRPDMSAAFIRKWNYYLCYCEAAFAMRNINVMQLVYTRPNNMRR
ncbi:SAM-dependent methyltransferase [Chitinophaga sancti]|uniref:Cyclopropane-fatty-acyl-phospholipid synthase n=1 Tax=Chitinophaga sancti TaxID=1004 RepID=A0A1K1STJ0_9BACT|nr:cyclopropane-fatty-acyl-phospholipid synthase family protein [Chitinophaga sancti]WQD60842.1 cyclopropane-fatty-acyl-phospholipid synthase family protein [Chitinophaga sancti]WQG87030.1 cyclopropane-fatty-acyl-phospholipid synthase family protein [Chitinophaga sancti]SFW87635.1 cyclopropane-fatty-acyl-phospholipid synthase [Chitinophaga sancti]